MVLERFKDHSQLLAEEEVVLVILPTNRQTHKIFTVFISFSFISFFFCTFLLLFGDMCLFYNSWEFYILSCFSLSISAWKSVFECSLNNPLGHRNCEGNLGGGIIIQIGKVIRICLPSCVCIRKSMHVGFDHEYAPLILRTYSTGQKTLATSLKYKIAIEGLQTFVKMCSKPKKRSVSTLNGRIHSFRGFSMD